MRAVSVPPRKRGRFRYLYPVIDPADFLPRNPDPIMGPERPARWPAQYNGRARPSSIPKGIGQSAPPAT